MRIWPLLGLVGVVGLIVGGCSLTPSGGFNILPPGTGGSGGTSGGGGGTGGSSVSGATAGSRADALTSQFPDCEEPLDVAELRAEVLSLVNQARVGYGQDPVVRNEILEAQATQYACELIAYDFFDHVNPVTGSDVQQRTEDFGYDYTWVGENLAGGQRSPSEVVQSWLASPCHRKNILHPAFTELGVGIRVGGKYGWYWVQEFGRPATEPAYRGGDFDVPGCDH